jgi:hypothetical protein
MSKLLLRYFIFVQVLAKLLPPVLALKLFVQSLLVIPSSISVNLPPLRLSIASRGSSINDKVIDLTLSCGNFVGFAPNFDNKDI